jgi:arylsulfatase A
VSALDSLGLTRDTIVIFLSDNGPSLLRGARGGCAGLLRCGKGTAWEGGLRVPAAISYPALIPPGRLDQPVSARALLPTVLGLVDRPAGRPVASVLAATLAAEQCVLYWPAEPDPSIGPHAIRCGAHKAHLYTQGSALSDDSNPDAACRSSARLERHSPPLLFHLAEDPGERHDLSEEQPHLAASLAARLASMAAEVAWAPSQMARGNSWLAAPCCRALPCSPWPGCCDC